MDRLYVEPHRLREVWDFVRPGLLEVREHSYDAWIPEDVYTDCFNGKAMLWLLMTDKPVGFGVVQPMGDTLHVWIGWGAWTMGEGFRHAKEIAKAGGAKKVSFESRRPGWEKLAKKHGFRPAKWIAEV